MVGALAEDLREKTYQPRGYFGYGSRRQTAVVVRWGFRRFATGWCKAAAVLVLGSIFEADLPSEQHAYRAGHSAHDAVRRAHALVSTGHP